MSKSKKLLVFVFVVTVSLLMGACSFYRSVPSREQCDSCKQKYSEESLVYGFSERRLCLDCMDAELRSIKFGEYDVCTECSIRYQSYPNSFGMCEDCSVELVDWCVNCDQRGLSWGSDSDFFLCDTCMGIALNDPKVEEVLLEIYE